MFFVSCLQNFRGVWLHVISSSLLYDANVVVWNSLLGRVFDSAHLGAVPLRLHIQLQDLGHARQV